MNKKSILKKYVGKGGPFTDKVKGTMARIGSAVSSAARGATNSVGRRIRQYRDFAARERALDREAGKIQGPRSSNQYNVDEFIKIKRKLKEKRPK